MTTFETGAQLDVTVNPSSLRSARQTIEDEIGDVQVDVSTSAGGGGGSGSRIAGRERAMSRQLLSSQDESLMSIDDAWTDNLDLNEERNDLLQQLLEQSEKDSQTSRGGRMGSMGMGGIGLALGVGAVASSIGANIVTWLSDAMPSIGPGDIVDPVQIGPGHIIDAAASVEASDVVTTAATVGVGNVVGTAATVTVGALVASKATITPTSVIDTAASISATDLISVAADISATALITTGASISPGDVVANAAAVAAADLVSGTITAEALMEHLTDSGSSSSSGTGPTGDTSTDIEVTPEGTTAVGETPFIDPEGQPSMSERYHTPLQDADIENAESTGEPVDVTAGSDAYSTGPDGTGGSTDWEALGKTGLAAGSLAAGATLAAADGPLPFGDAAGAGIAARGGGAALLSGVFAGSAAGQEGPQSASRGSGSGNQSTTETAEVNQENRIEINADLSDLEREVTDQVRDLEQQVNDLENALQRRR